MARTGKNKKKIDEALQEASSQDVQDQELVEATEALEELQSLQNDSNEPDANSFVPAGKTIATTPSIPDDSVQDDEGALSALQSLERRRKKKRRKIIVRIAIILALLVLAFIFKSIFGLLSHEETFEELRYEPVIQETWKQSVNASGSAQPNSVYVVTPEVIGIIDTVDVQEGQKVKKGDRLLTVHSADVKKQVEEAQTAVNSAQATVDSAYQNAMDAYNKEAAGVEGYEGATAAAQAELDSASAALESAKQALSEVQALAAKQTITAPADGTVTVMNAVKGAGLGTAEGGSVNNASTLIQIADLSKMRVRVQVRESEVSLIKAGQDADVSFAALPDLQLKGTVERIATVATGTEGGEDGFGNGSSMYSVDIVIDKPDERIKPGMTATVDIVTEVIEDALQIPMMALLYADPADEESAFVEVIDEGADLSNISLNNQPPTHYVYVKVVKEDSGIYIVDGDLKGGDLLLLLGASDKSMESDVVDEDMGAATSVSVAVA